MLSTLDKINYFSTARHLDSYDFSTLYTSIPHVALKTALKHLIEEAYRVRDCEFIVADGIGRATGPMYHHNHLLNILLVRYN